MERKAKEEKRIKRPTKAPEGADESIGRTDPAWLRRGEKQGNTDHDQAKQSADIAIDDGSIPF